MLTLIACLILVLLKFVGVETHIIFIIIWVVCTIYCTIVDIVLMSILTDVAVEYKKRR